MTSGLFMNIVYVKYNRGRLPEFQTVTSILRKGNNLVVTKCPLTAAAVPHIMRMNAYSNKSGLSPHFSLPTAELHQDCLSVEYIEGTSFDRILFDLLTGNNINSFEKLLIDFKQRVESTCQYFEAFTTDENFRKTFGIDLNLTDAWCQATPNIDMIFENIIITDDKYHLIDFEWTFDFPIPSFFILYRCIDNFYSKYRDDISKHHSMERLWNILGFHDEQLTLARTLEARFQQYVNGTSHKYSINISAKKEVQTLNDLISSRKQLMARLNELEQFLSDKSATVEALTVEKVSMSALIFQKDTELGSLRGENSRLMGQTDDLTGQLEQAREEIVQRWGDIVYRDGRIMQIGEELARAIKRRAEQEDRLQEKSVELADSKERTRQIEEAVSLQMRSMDDMLRKQGEALQLTTEQLWTTREEVARTMEERAAERRGYAQQMREKEQRIEDLLNSMSWKVTAPLRKTLDLIKKKQ